MRDRSPVRSAWCRTSPRAGAPALARQAQLADGLLELALDVPPLAHPQEGQEVVPAHAPQMGRPPALGLTHERPQLEEPREVRVLVTEAPVQLVCLLRELPWPLARVLQVERRGDDEHLVQAPVLDAGENHPRDARVHREARELVPERRQGALLALDGPELLEHPPALGDGLRLGRVEEGEVLDVTEAERLHPQDDAREPGALDFRVGEGGPRGEAHLVVEAHADSLAHAAAAPFALVGAGLGDRLDVQARGARARLVARQARHARVHDVHDARDGDRRLRDVGGEDDPALGDGGEDTRLLGGRQARIQGLHHRAAELARVQRILGLADFPLPGEEHEDVPVRVEREDVRHRIGDGVGELGVLGGRLVEHVHRKGTALHLDDRSPPEELREALGLDGGRAHHHLEVGAPGEDALEPPEQEVDGEAALVGLVEHDRVVAAQERVAVNLREQDPVGHELHGRLPGRAVLEANLVADVRAQLRSELACHARRHARRGDTPGLGDANLARAAAPQGEQDFRQLSRLPRACGPRDNDDLMGGDGRFDVLHPARDGEFGGEVQGGQAAGGGDG